MANKLPSVGDLKDRYSDYSREELNKLLGNINDNLADWRTGGVTDAERRKIDLARRRKRAARLTRAGMAGENSGVAPVEPWTATQESAWALMQQTLESYGLGSLGGKLKELIEQGKTDQGSLTLELQSTNEWRQRFKGNEALKQAGLPVLSVAEYLATERSYAQVMKNYGLPTGFYDGPEDFADFIGKSVSASELQERVQAYSDLANREDPAVRAQLQAMGMSEGDLLAFTMDPDRANPLIQRKYKATLVGAAARRTGLTADNEYAERLAGMGVTEQQAQAGYGLISENLTTLGRLGEIYGVDYDQGDFEAEVFEQSGEATRKRKRLASQERAAFSGSSGISRGSLARDTSGQY